LSGSGAEGCKLEKHPSGAKALKFKSDGGTAEAVPLQNEIQKQILRSGRRGAPPLGVTGAWISHR